MSKGENMIKIAMIGVVAMILAVFLKKYHPEYSIYIALAGGMLIFSLGLSQLESILQMIKQIKEYISLDEGYITLLIRMIGIAYIAEFASSLCRDAGEGTIAGQIDFVGKLTILGISMPVLLSLLDTIQSFLE